MTTRKDDSLPFNQPEQDSDDSLSLGDGITIRGEELVKLESEIATRIQGETGLLGRAPSKERRREIRDEVEDIYRSRAQAGRELARNDDMETTPVPYVEDFDAAIEHFGGGEGIHSLDTYTKAGGKEDDISKDAFIDVPLVIMQWWFSEGEMGAYVTFKFVTKGPVKGYTKFVMVDSSTGILAQLQETTRATGKQTGLLVRSGFRVSRYEFKGQPQRTYYLT